MNYRFKTEPFYGSLLLNGSFESEKRGRILRSRFQSIPQMGSTVRSRFLNVLCIHERNVEIGIRISQCDNIPR